MNTEIFEFAFRLDGLSPAEVDVIRKTFVAHGFSDVVELEYQPAGLPGSGLAGQLLVLNASAAADFAKLSSALSPQFRDRITVRSLPAEGWSEAWSQSQTWFQAGRFWVSWGDDPQPTNATILRLQSAATFGNGQHATTQACLQLLSDLTFANLGSFLDVGCGTGMLALAANALGFQDIHATDIDEAAIAETALNCRAAGFSVRTYLGTLPSAGSNLMAFDAIACNVLFPENIAICRTLIPLCHESTTVIVAGLMEHEVKNLVAALPEFNVTGQVDVRAWSAVALKLKSADSRKSRA